MTYTNYQLSAIENSMLVHREVSIIYLFCYLVRGYLPSKVESRTGVESRKDDFEEFAECIHKKVVEKSEGAISYPPGSYLVFGFIDDTTIRTCRPGGVPAEEGENAERNSKLLQEAFYSGYKKHHGIKFQSVELPNGMCADLFGRSPTETLMLISSLQVAWFRHYLKLLETVSNLQSTVMESFLPQVISFQSMLVTQIVQTGKT